MPIITDYRKSTQNWHYLMFDVQNTTTTTTSITTTTTTADLIVDADGDGKFDYALAGCSNLEGNCDYNDSVFDSNQIALINNDGSSTGIENLCHCKF